MNAVSPISAFVNRTHSATELMSLIDLYKELISLNGIVGSEALKPLRNAINSYALKLAEEID